MGIDIFSRKFAVESGFGMHIASHLQSEYNPNKTYNTTEIFHYTDISGFLGIIDSREFWLSHIRFMNDSQEYVDGKNRCQTIIDGFHRTDPIEQEFLQRLRKSLEKDTSDGFNSRSSKDVFSLSFSRNGDSLDMWRGYGHGGGIAIGFDLSSCNAQPGLSFIRKEQYDFNLKHRYRNDPKAVKPENERRLFATNIIYDDIIKEKIISEAIQIGFEHLKFKQVFSPDIALKSAVNGISDAMFELFPLFKNSAFVHEEECRILENIARNGDETQLDVHYRPRNGIILPYTVYNIMDINCKRIEHWPISKIVIGPSPKQVDLIKSVIYFLEQRKLSDLIDKVFPSNIPFVY